VACYTTIHNKLLTVAAILPPQRTKVIRYFGRFASLCLLLWTGLLLNVCANERLKHKVWVCKYLFLWPQHGVGLYNTSMRDLLDLDMSIKYGNYIRMDTDVSKWFQQIESFITTTDTYRYQTKSFHTWQTNSTVIGCNVTNKSTTYIHTYIHTSEFSCIAHNKFNRVTMRFGRQTRKFSEIVWKCQMTVPAVVVLVESHSTGGDRRLSMKNYKISNLENTKNDEKRPNSCDRPTRPKAQTTQLVES